jgi:8-oxo-dGTP pyrophosphatase MutT (NUDIX family)
MLSEAMIARRLAAAFQPGGIPFNEGVADMPGSADLHCAAVLIPMAGIDGEWHLVFTRRTEEVEHHKGQVSFPGGRCDPQETSIEATALREAHEEIGLHPRDVRLLGRLNDMETITGYRVTPVVGAIPHPYEFSLSPGEVNRLFTVPLVWLADGKNYSEREVTPEGSPRAFPVVIYEPYDGEIIWGATARMVVTLVQVLGLPV